MSRKTGVLIVILTTLAAAGLGAAALAQEDPPPVADDSAHAVQSARAADADGPKPEPRTSRGEAQSIELDTHVIAAHRYRLTCMVTLDTGQTGACALSSSTCAISAFPPGDHGPLP